MQRLKIHILTDVFRRVTNMKRRITFQESIFLNPSRKERVTCSMFKNIRNFNIRKHRKRENRNIKKKTKRRKKLSRIIPFQRRKFKRKGTRLRIRRGWQKGRGRTEAVQVSDAAISQDVSWRGSREWSVGVTPGRGYGAVIAGENLWKTAGHR